MAFGETECRLERRETRTSSFVCDDMAFPVEDEPALQNIKAIRALHRMALIGTAVGSVPSPLS